MASRTTLAASSSPLTFYHIRHKSLPPLSTTVHPSNGLPSPPATPGDASARSDKAGLSLVPGLEDGVPVKTPSPSAASASASSSEIAFSCVGDSSATSPLSPAPSVLETAKTRPRRPLETPTSLIAPECPELESGRSLVGGLPAATSVDISGEVKDAGPKLESSGTFSRREIVKSGGTYREIMDAITSCQDGGAERQRMEVSEEGDKKDKNLKEGKRRRVKLLFATSRAFLGRVMNPTGGKSG